MTVNIIKKDGRVEQFRLAKIKSNIESAQRVYGVTCNTEISQLLTNINTHVHTHEQLTSDELLEIIKQELAGDPLVLLAFKEFKREQADKLNNATNVHQALTQYNDRDPKIMNENGNKDARTFATQREILAGVLSKAMGLDLYPESVKRAHIKGVIHLHDLDISPYQGRYNCSLPDFNYLLANGFTLGNAVVDTPNSIGVATTLLAQLISSLSSEQYGGISVHELDKLLAPYALKTYTKNKELYAEVLTSQQEIKRLARKKTKKDIYDAMQALEFQINTMTTSTAQVPFTTVSYGLGTSWLEREIQKSHLEVRYNGLADGSTAIFPKILYFVDEGLNLTPNDPNYDIKQIAIKTSMRRIYPDLISVPQLKAMKEGRVVTAMGCRSFLHPWKRPTTGQYEELGRNNLGVVSINLPHIALQSNGDLPTFWGELREACHIAKEALLVREESVLNADVNEAPIMYTQGGMGDPTGKTTVRDFYTGDNYKRSSISLGYVGLHNTIVALTGDEFWQSNSEYVTLSHEILQFLADYCTESQPEFETFVSLYSTPSESLADRFESIDEQRFGRIKGVTDRGYYENSFHFPSYQETDPFSKIAFEAPYSKIAVGGFMHFVETPSLLTNPKAFEQIWDEAFTKVPYFGVNAPNDKCFECGFEGEFKATKKGYECPSCGNQNPDTCDVVRRLAGYLGQPMKRPVVSGKQEEIAGRVKHI